MCVYTHVYMCTKNVLVNIGMHMHAEIQQSIRINFVLCLRAKGYDKTHTATYTYTALDCGLGYTCGKSLKMSNLNHQYI